ncbi:MAG: DUF2764 domain-containing protein [Prevotella sp.]|jgi:hypothetical protein|nr:DUF2764 domain-containing protein [Prevotella sp.]
MSQYYYLVTGLPELSLDDNKLNYTVGDFKTEFYPQLSKEDQALVDLYYLKFDNANLLKLLKDREAVIDPRGNYTADQFVAVFKQFDEEGVITSPGSLPPYIIKFIQAYLTQQAAGITSDVLVEDWLAGLYFEHAMQCKNDFVSSWFEFNLNTNNVLVALAARKYKLPIASFIVGDTEICQALKTSNARDFGLTTELDYFDQLLKISETDDLVEREKRLDQLRWKWMEDKTFFDYFSIERLYVFLLQLEIIERWISLDKEKGNQMFREIIDSLKGEVRVPSEF